MTTSAELTTQVGIAVDELNKAKNLFEGIREETNQNFLTKAGEMDAYIESARKEYNRFYNYLALEKVTIPALGLTDAEVENYGYSQASDYAPAKQDGTLCFADIPEFKNGFTHLEIPNGLFVYLHLLVNVVGSTLVQSTKVHILRADDGQVGYSEALNYSVPFLFNNDGNSNYIIEGRDHSDKYNDLNQLKVTNFNQFNSMSSGSLRILNLGENDLEILGIGLEVRA